MLNRSLPAAARSARLASVLLAGVIALAPATAFAKFGKSHEQKPLATYNQKDSTYQYISAVFDKLQAFWSKQGLEQRMAANSVISFTLNGQGNVISSNVESSSTSDEIGTNALNYVKQTGSFGAMPDSVTGQNLEFKFKLSPESLQMLSYRFSDNPQIANAAISSAAPTTSSPAAVSSLFYARVVDNAEAGRNGKVENKAEAKVSDEAVMEEYVSSIREQISQQWRQPNETVTTGPAMATLQIDRDGSLLGAILNQSSGNKEVDRAILNTIYQSVPFAPAPKQVQSLPVTVQYVFEPVVNTVYVRQQNLP
jgi:TonB family protein